MRAQTTNDNDRVFKNARAGTFCCKNYRQIDCFGPLKGKSKQTTVSKNSVSLVWNWVWRKSATSISVPYLLQVLYGSLAGVIDIYCLFGHISSLPYFLPLAGLHTYTYIYTFSQDLVAHASYVVLISYISGGTYSLKSTPIFFVLFIAAPILAASLLSKDIFYLSPGRQYRVQ